MSSQANREQTTEHALPVTTTNSAMAGIELREPFLEAGIRNTHFFNGRLLTAEDLLNEQEANRAQHRQLGRAIGAGIVTGFEVTLGTQGKPRPSVRVRPGLAVNRRGQAVELPQKAGSVEVMLAKAPEEPVVDKKAARRAAKQRRADEAQAAKAHPEEAAAGEAEGA